MAVGRGGRSLIGPLLIDLGGNPPTSFMLIFAMIGGAIGVCSVVAGLMHHRVWCSDSLAITASSAIIPWALTSLAFGLVVCNEILKGGQGGKRLKTLEAFIAISTLSQLLYLVVLHAGMFTSRYRPSYCSRGGTGTTHDPPKTSATAVI